MANVFFSYTHKDEAKRDELEIHLSLLKRNGTIETWHDRRIESGQEFENEIDENLEKADIVLLLVSHYFIDSDYCFNIELKRAIEKHEEGTAIVIPVILSPCDWHSSPFGRILASTKDGKPLTKYPDINDGYLETVESIKKAISRIKPITVVNEKPIKSTTETLFSSHPRSSNLHIRKEFSDQEKDAFLKQSFKYISDFFEGSLSELEKRNNSITTDFQVVDSTKFTAIVYNNGTRVSSCTIYTGNSFGSNNQIYYSDQINSYNNGFNESLSVSFNAQSLFLSPLGMGAIMFGSSKSELSQEGAGEYLWGMLIKYLQ